MAIVFVNPFKRKVKQKMRMMTAPFSLTGSLNKSVSIKAEGKAIEPESSAGSPTLTSGGQQTLSIASASRREEAAPGGAVSNAPSIEDLYKMYTSKYYKNLSIYIYKDPEFGDKFFAVRGTGWMTTGEPYTMEQLEKYVDELIADLDSKYEKVKKAIEKARKAIEVIDRGLDFVTKELAKINPYEANTGKLYSLSNYIYEYIIINPNVMMYEEDLRTLAEAAHVVGDKFIPPGEIREVIEYESSFFMPPPYKLWLTLKLAKTMGEDVYRSVVERLEERWRRNLALYKEAGQVARELADRVQKLAQVRKKIKEMLNEMYELLKKSTQ